MRRDLILHEKYFSKMLTKKVIYVIAMCFLKLYTQYYCNICECMDQKLIKIILKSFINFLFNSFFSLSYFLKREILYDQKARSLEVSINS